MLFIGYSILTGVGFGILYMGTVTIVSLWFDRYRATACGIAVSGNGTGTFFNAFILEFFIQLAGWRSAMLFEAAVAAQCCICAMFLRPPPPVKNTAAVKQSEEEETSILKTDIKVEDSHHQQHSFIDVCKELIVSPRFLGFFINNLTWPLGVMVFYSFAVRVAIKEAEFVVSDAVWAVSIIGLVDGAARIVFGVTGSMLRIPATYFYYFGQLGVGLVITTTPYIYHTISPFLASVLFGIFFGAQIGSLVPATAELFDSEKISSILGILIVANGISAGVGPIISDLLLQALNESYRPVYLIVGLLLLAGLMVITPLLIKHWRKLQKVNSAKKQTAKTIDVLQADGQNDEL